jgi:hypothetical protein
MVLLIPGFSPWRFIGLRDNMHYFLLLLRDFPIVSTCVSQRLVPIKDMYMIGIVVVFASKIELTQFHMDLREMSIYNR